MRAVRLPAGQTVAIVGEASYQATIARACGPIRRERVHCEITAALVPEPDNRYDRNAVAVYVGGEKVGYLSRRDARDYQPAMQALRAAGYRAGVCRGCIAGHGPASEKMNLGVFLYLAAPEELLDALR